MTLGELQEVVYAIVPRHLCAVGITADNGIRPQCATVHVWIHRLPERVRTVRRLLRALGRIHPVGCLTVIRTRTRHIPIRPSGRKEAKS